MEILKKFIKDNDLVFGPGSRNTPLTALCGFALYKNLTFEDVRNALDTDDKYILSKDDKHTLMEAERVFNYAKLNGYNSWWETEENRNKYVLE